VALKLGPRGARTNRRFSEALESVHRQRRGPAPSSACLEAGIAGSVFAGRCSAFPKRQRLCLDLRLSRSPIPRDRRGPGYSNFDQWAEYVRRGIEELKKMEPRQHLGHSERGGTSRLRRSGPGARYAGAAGLFTSIPARPAKCGWNGWSRSCLNIAACLDAVQRPRVQRPQNRDRPLFQSLMGAAGKRGANPAGSLPRRSPGPEVSRASVITCAILLSLEWRRFGTGAPKICSFKPPLLPRQNAPQRRLRIRNPDRIVSCVPRRCAVKPAKRGKPRLYGPISPKPATIGTIL